MGTVYMVKRDEQGKVKGVSMSGEHETDWIESYEQSGYVRVTQEEALAALKEMLG